MWRYHSKFKNITWQTTEKTEEKAIRQRVDEILDKINEGGWNNITEQEEKYLNQASKILFGDRPPN